MAREQWSDFTSGQRKAILAASAMEVVLTTTALVDLARRPSVQVRGSKPLWVLGCFVQPIGPIAYLTFGRLPRPAEPEPLPSPVTSQAGRTAMAGIGEVYKRHDGKWAFRVKAKNGEIVATDGGQGYDVRADAKSTLKKLMSGKYHGKIKELD